MSCSIDSIEVEDKNGKLVCMPDEKLKEYIINAKTRTKNKYMDFVFKTQAMTGCEPMETRDSGGKCNKSGIFESHLLKLEKEEEQEIQKFRNKHVARIENERNQEVRAPVEVRPKLEATAAKKIPEFEAEAARTYEVGSMNMAAKKLPKGEANVATMAEPDYQAYKSVGSSGQKDGHIEKCIAKHAREPGQPDGQKKKCDVRMSMNGKVQADIPDLLKAMVGPNEMMSFMSDASTVTLDMDGSGLGECAELFKCIVQRPPDY